MQTPIARGVTAVAALFVLTTLGACTATPEAGTTTPATTESSTDATPTVAASDEATDGEDGTQRAALEAVIQVAQPQLDSLAESMSDTYSSIELVAEGDDTISYVYTYVDMLDAEATAEQFDAQVETLQSGVDGQVFPAMQQAGIANPKVRYTYLNADGTEIWTHVFEPSA